MSTSKVAIKKILTGNIPDELTDNLTQEYKEIKEQYFLRKFRPSELNGARFGECILRIIEFLCDGKYTPFGAQLNSEKIIKDAENNTSLKTTIRFFIPRLTRVILDVRNKRDIAHVGGEVNPNYSDSKFVINAADWLLTEIVRHFHNCSIDDARKIVESINESKIPIVANVNGFIRVQNTDLNTADKILVVLYYKNPLAVKDTDLGTWLRYKNLARMKKQILKDLDDKALVHYESGLCVLLPKGIKYVEDNIPFELIS